jgi:hypothetical protein
MAVEQRLGKRRAAQRAWQRIGPALEDMDTFDIVAFEELEAPAVPAEEIPAPIEQLHRRRTIPAIHAWLYALPMAMGCLGS